MNVIPLKNSAEKVGLVRGSALQPPDRSLFVSKRLEEHVGKAFRIERHLRESGNGFFDFNSIHKEL